MSKRHNLTGQRFVHLKVIEYSPRKTAKCRNSHWLCKCDCGNYLIVRCDNLMSGRTTQCSDCGKHGGNPSVFVKDVMINGVV